MSDMERVRDNEVVALRTRVAELEAEVARLAVYELECRSISEEMGLPPTMRPVEGEFKRMRDQAARVGELERQLDACVHVGKAVTRELGEKDQEVKVLTRERDAIHDALNAYVADDECVDGADWAGASDECSCRYCAACRALGKA